MLKIEEYLQEYLEMYIVEHGMKMQSIGLTTITLQLVWEMYLEQIQP